MDRLMQVCTTAFPLCTRKEMERRLEGLKIDEKFKPIILPYLLRYTDGQKTASGVDSVIRGMLYQIAYFVTDDEYDQILAESEKFIIAIVDKSGDTQTSIDFWNGKIQLSTIS